MSGAPPHELHVGDFVEYYVATVFVVVDSKISVKKLTFIGTATLIGITILPVHSQEHSLEQNDKLEKLTPGVERSESDSHYSDERWLDPPTEYADKTSNVWADVEAIARGKKIWGKYCVSCHGKDGQGAGLISESLSHLPADLSNNFHTAPGIGDAYLFWRVSEGGTVEPFSSMGSQMPPFKSVLSESQRWDVLAYVHAFFHQGLVHWTLPNKQDQ